ncbi:MAG: glutathione S-transferase [Gammaproteobacteria bacterium]|nr:glutathione S-transferase [Gammaproteobacteria bacterium]
MLQILGRSTSLNVRKVLWLCEELELQYELQPWGAGHRSTDAPEFRALNPNALVPVILDGSFVLWESNTICRYLAASQGNTALLPAAPADRALVEQWMDWQLGELNPAWRYAFMSLARRSPAHTDAAAIAASVSSWNRCMAVLDAQLLKTGAFVTGDRFTVADIVLGLSTHRWFMTPLERPALPAVTDYYERLSQRPAFMAHGRNGVP